MAAALTVMNGNSFDNLCTKRTASMANGRLSGCGKSQKTQCLRIESHVPQNAADTACQARRGGHASQKASKPACARDTRLKSLANHSRCMTRNQNPVTFATRREARNGFMANNAVLAGFDSFQARARTWTPQVLPS
ncbi:MULTISPECIES: hypothetical protein [unclassified Polaromonas]|uniref:hypothetical protein n=1 Tax=unclassified Polaromonas TaxID=2638319 RepID=UPI0018CBCA54|nr:MULTISPECIES: hypothetical protein [unclassified Polaromonas]MBG6071298.1 hypothetical protein [Polaromonas sp. CG_9.7]MBG6113298.1 hypothetical protein [Polaromonas sp. CG_9.2]MDH6183247.1 hypothetical protein [Polaromonas sp. CG_23.6]